MKKLILLLNLVLSVLTLQAQTADVIELPIAQVDGAIFYSNPAYSSEGAYDYYIGFSAEGGKLPWFELDVFMPTNEGITPGTYMLEEGQIGDVLLLQTEQDKFYAQAGYDLYAFGSATMTISDHGDGLYEFEFRGTDANGKSYHFDVYGTCEITEYSGTDSSGDDNDSSKDYHYESTDKVNINTHFSKVKATDMYVKDNDIYWIKLNSDPINDAKDTYQSELYFITETEGDIPAGTYPINFTENNETFLASYGATASGADYPCYIQTRDADDYIIADWYFVDGAITVGYTDKDELYLIGNATSFHGSKIHFTAGPVPEGADGIGTVLAPTTVVGTHKIMTREGVRLQQSSGVLDLQGVRR